MATKRVHELAKDLGLGNKELLDSLARWGIEVKGVASMLDEAQVALIRERLAASGARVSTVSADEDLSAFVADYPGLQSRSTRSTGRGTEVRGPGGHTIEEWLAQPEDARLELIDGVFVEKAAPTLDHGRVQLQAGTQVFAAFDRKPGGPGGPGGWWIASEVDIALDGRGFRPDIAGWRRERMPVRPTQRPVTDRPDWICEVVSDSNRSNDFVKKLRYYAQSGVPHYWIIDTPRGVLTVFRLGPDGYIVALVAGPGETVRAEPFDAIELSVSRLLGDDE